MEQKARYALIGAFVILTVLALIAFAAWLSNAQLDQQYDEYVIEFDGPVRGISQGSEVRLRGLSVGQVTGLSFDPTNPNLVRVATQVYVDTPIFSDAYVQLEPQGITGLNYIQIFPGDSTKPRLKETGRSPGVLPGRMSQFDSFLDSGSNIIADAGSTLKRLNVALNDTTIRDFQDILNNTNALTKTLRDVELDPELINQVLKAFLKAAEKVTVAADEVDKTSKEFDIFVATELEALVESAESTLAKAEVLMADFSSAAGDAGELATDLRTAVNRVSNSSLTDLEQTAGSLRRLVNSLNILVDRIEENPTRFIAGKKREVMELPQ